MNDLMWILWGALIACGALLLFMLLRTALLRPPKETENSQTPPLPDLDESILAAHLSEAVAIPTVSLVSPDDDGRHFLEFHAWLERTYPALHAAAEKTVINKFSLIYRIKGSDETLKPLCFLSHQDVVPATPEGWEAPPFGGEIKDGYIYGRGSMDMKSQLVATVEAVEYILKHGGTPKRGIYLCFGHDEEVSSEHGAPYIAAYLKERGVSFEYLIDEGGIMADGNILGVPHTIALIGTCEKGYADIKLTSKRDGGHASSPKRPTCLGLLAKAILSIEKHPMKTTFNQPTKELFRDFAPYMRFIFRFFMANRDILSPLLRAVFTLIPMTNSLVRTTFAPTMATGADRRNVLPAESTANINVRILTGDNSAGVLKHIQKTVGKNISAEITNVTEPCPVSPTDTPQYRALTKALKEVWSDLIAAPYMFIAASDARFYYGLTPNVYRFTPFKYALSDQARIHALNERCEVKALVPAVAFFIRCIENSCMD
ncbi:MAG: M20/M25/M40 family metallo-hydrolase [Clostridiaceae bacterium]|jgi:carboxypeptidase PM20D1|nr:M20/M25/M40 family metallo-hydrolase [Clostridiaceae bacterium]